VGGRKERKKKKKGRGVGVVRASWVSHHGNSDVWHYAMSEFQMFSYKKTPLLVQIFRLYIYIQIHVCASFSILTNKLCIKFTKKKLPVTSD
jgi:hypothetical protein